MTLLPKQRPPILRRQALIFGSAGVAGFVLAQLLGPIVLLEILDHTLAHWIFVGAIIVLLVDPKFFWHSGSRG
jgi:hypothetical protein